MRRSVRALGALVLALVALAGAGCTPTVNPATGERQYTSLSREDEVRLGRQEHPKVLNEFGGAYADPELQAYVEGIGEKLRGVSETPGERFTFTVLDSDVVNAFALPGGYVYVSRGLVALANDEAELAGVIGHEIGHVTARHTAQRLDRAQTASVVAQGAGLVATVLGGLLLGDAGAQLGGQVGGGLAGLGAQAYVQGYSREQELQSDELGVRYLARASYDPQAMADFLDQLAAHDALQQGLTGRRDTLPSWLASHPRTKDRVERAIDAAGLAGLGGERGRDAFLRVVDGMVFGDNPDQGLIEGTRFVHPKLGFEFTAPPGFRLRNQAANVVGADGAGRRLIFDMDPRATGDPVAYLQRLDIGGQRAEQVARRTVAGRPAAVGILRFPGRPLLGLVGAIQDTAGTYRFVFLKEGNLSRAEVDAFVASIASWAPLAPGVAARYVPLRIRVVTVGPGDTVESLAARMAVDRGRREWFETLNDIGDRPLRAGERVKIVVRG
jgi:predicted Zn-dependent protease